MRLFDMGANTSEIKRCSGFSLYPNIFAKIFEGEFRQFGGDGRFWNFSSALAN
jgi:hypothetical protein